MATVSSAAYAAPTQLFDALAEPTTVPPRTLVQPPESTRGMHWIAWTALMLKVVVGVVFIGCHGRRVELEPVPIREDWANRR